MKELHDHMCCLAKSFRLPISHETDLDRDLQILESFPGSQFIWLLRTSGTVLVPVGIGVDPQIVTYWLLTNHGQTVIPFLVDSEAFTIEKLSFEEAERLIQQPPKRLSTFQSREEIYETVESVLTFGLTKRIWGVFDSPDLPVDNWNQWHRYFQRSGNTVMLSFIGKAIRCSARFSQEKFAAA